MQHVVTQCMLCECIIIKPCECHAQAQRLASSTSPRAGAMPRKRKTPAEVEGTEWLEASAVRHQMRADENPRDYAATTFSMRQMARDAASSSSAPAASSSSAPAASSSGDDYQSMHRSLGFQAHRATGLLATGFEPQRHTYFIEGRPVQVIASFTAIAAH